MADIVLDGLRGSHPLGFLAALGLLRACHETARLRGTRLAWRPGDFVARIETVNGVTAETLVDELVKRQPSRTTAFELTWSNSPRVAHEVYRTAASQAVSSATPGDRRTADFFAALASGVGDVDSGLVWPTAFYMTSGRQEFLKEVRSVAAAVANGRKGKSPADMFREALFGPWRYDDAQHSLGWDPSTERLHALRAKSPTKEGSSGVGAAVWLAFEALPFFPCVLSAGKSVTAGFHREAGPGAATYFSWPLWEPQLSIATIASLLTTAELADRHPPTEELRSRGILAVFRAERYKVKTQGNYYILRPAFPCE